MAIPGCSCRFSPTAGRSTVIRMPNDMSLEAGPMPDRIRIAGDPNVPAAPLKEHAINEHVVYNGERWELAHGIEKSESRVPTGRADDVCAPQTDGTRRGTAAGCVSGCGAGIKESALAGGKPIVFVDSRGQGTTPAAYSCASTLSVLDRVPHRTERFESPTRIAQYCGPSIEVRRGWPRGAALIVGRAAANDARTSSWR